MSTICELRKKVFSTIEKLEKGTIKKEEAIAIGNLAQVFINTVKVEIEAAKVLKGFKPTDVFKQIESEGITDHEEIKTIPIGKFVKGVRVEIIETGKTGIIEYVNNSELKASVKTNIGLQEVEFENLLLL